jgi:DNA-directed RNA polymerase subunit RPC12/RpoP
MDNQKYLNSFARCPRCNTRLFGKIKATSMSQTLDAMSFKKVSVECRCTKCGQLFDSHPNARSRALFSLLISIAIMIPTVPIALVLGALIHISVGIVLAFLTMWAGLQLPALLMPALLMPAYKPKNIGNPNKSSDPT